MIFWLLLFFIVGSAVGSFLNVVIDRSVRRESILGRSYCEHCRATLKSLDLIPILSFVSLGGRCRYCRRKLSLQYPAVEALTGILFVGSFYALVQNGTLLPSSLPLFLFLVSIFVVVSVVDMKFSLIPTTLVFLAAFVVLFYNYINLSSNEFVLSVSAGFVLALSFALVIILTRGRGMGTGDVPLVFLIGLALSWPLTLVSVFVSFFSGAVLSLLLLALGKKKFGQTIPFAPFLTGGAILTMFWGKFILDWYLGLLQL